ncbi:DNA repair protein RecO [Salipaludibacillus aurantiacus]|uniref:DNA repair protein RecO n=1 Tax=Salipaludibacillus aurantiacus TaxID=1601833 RepID=A0A1H9RC69_9BACI|nr:DNA repair protein RecO [Salipaludibacillus aurantiacus]SER70258.1 DNA replication and repair protein RecO [Salipaludibacillus aurantiacus]
MLQKIEGIIIRTNDYGETNKILTVYSRENGKTALMARGAKRPKSRFASVSQLFVYGTFIYQKSKGIGTLNQADIIDSFRDVRSDLMVTAYGAVMVELIDRLTEDQDKNPYLFELLYQLLHHLNEGDDGEILLRILETKMLTYSGSTPTLHECANCGNTDLPFMFSLRFGGALCTQCLANDDYHLKVSPAVMKLLRLFQQINPARIGQISVKEETKKQLKEVLELYYQEYVGIKLKSKRFLDQMTRFSQPDVDS